jgi:hypothetical protein
MATANHNIWTPSGTSQLTPIQTPFITLANSVDTALEAVEQQIPAIPVANQAARDARFPTPKQGDAVYRLDRGWVERYYTAYNATSNPGGRVSAGWYAPSGTLLSVINANWPDSVDVDSTTSPFFLYRVALPDPGVPYRVQGLGGAEAGSTAAGTRWDLNIGVTATGSTSVIENLGVYTGGEDFWYKQVTSIPSAVVFTGSKDLVIWTARVYGNASARITKFNHRLRATLWAA